MITCKFDLSVKFLYVWLPPKNTFLSLYFKQHDNKHPQSPILSTSTNHGTDIDVPPKYSIAMVLGYLKGKSAIHIHRKAYGIKQDFTGRHFWSRGYCVSTIGLDEEMIRAYVRDQEHQDKQEELDFTKNT